MKNPNPWLRSAYWDGFWMLSGIWLLVILAVYNSAPRILRLIFIILTLILGIAHRFATSFNAFCNPAYRPLLLRQYPRFVLLPIAIFLAVFAFVFMPLSVIPLGLMVKAQILATIFFLYNTFHVGIQHYGVISIYRMRSRQDLSGGFKKYEKLFCLAVGSVLVALAQVGHGAKVVKDSILYRWWPQTSFTALFHFLKIIAPVSIICLTVIFYIFEFRSKKISLPKILYVTGLSAQGVLAYFLQPLSFFILWIAQHWIVSVALAAHMAQNDRSDTQSVSLWYKWIGGISRRFWLTVLVLCAVSIFLTPLIYSAFNPNRFKNLPILFSLLQPAFSIPWIASFFIAFNSASVYMHFVIDRAIFRFADPSVRSVSLPLLFADKS